jgi:signal transduction histidine kinase
MRFTFRAKLLTIVVPSALAFVILILAQSILTGRMRSQVTKIQSQYIPIIEFGPKLETDFEHLRRSFQDSVAAQDREGLAKALDIKNKLIAEVAEARAVIDSAQVSELGGAIEDYYTAADPVSRRLISGETGTRLVDSIAAMQSKQARVQSILKDALTFDRTKLLNAFSSIDKAQATSSKALITISVACLLIVVLLSIVLGRSVLNSLARLSTGLARFGRGQFAEPIVLPSHDEFEDLARDANEMATRVRGLMRELESFSYSVAHDLRAPLRSILGFSTIILEEHDQALPAQAKEMLGRVIAAAKRMGELVDSLLNLSRLARTEVKRDSVDLSRLAESVLEELRNVQPEKKVDVRVAKSLPVIGDSSLLQIVLTNLLNNAWKFTSKRAHARIELGVENRDGVPVYFIRDNGAGFDMQYVGKLFGTFQRLHSNQEFEGTGVGLATVQTIIRRHGGEIWAEGKPDQGATFFFTLSSPAQS